MSDLTTKEAFIIPEGSSLGRADILIQELLKMLKQEILTAETFDELGNRLRVPHTPEARIYFLTQLYQQVHDFPLRLFRIPERRDEMLHTIQDALDNAIISEE